jgi:hypothetical protein
MNKYIFLLLSVLLCTVAFAQIPKIKPVQNNTLPRLDGTIVGSLVTDIELFERPDYQGKSGYFRMVNGKLVAPFPLTDCSFKVPRGKIVYIRTNFEFASETAFPKSENKINLQNTTGVRSDDRIGLFISLDGISTAIHNNDCKRVYGTIKIKVLEFAPATDSTQSTMLRGAAPGSDRLRTILRSEEQWTFIPWNYADASAMGSIPYSRYEQFILNNAPAPAAVTHPRHRDVVQADKTAAFFYCGKKALQEGRIKLHFTSDIASAHKTCDLCDDFSSRIKMRTPAYEMIPLRTYYGPGTIDTTMKKIVLGPYRASGSRDGTAVTASAGTIKDFRTYYSIKLYE